MKTVCCVMLANGREAMVRRAIASFQAQTYGDRVLYILDSGEAALVDALPDLFPDHGIVYHNSRTPARTIGALRNYAMTWEPASKADIIIHWDSDDWSHPNRIAEQVALLESSGKQVVGYKNLLFWDQKPFTSEVTRHSDTCECGTCGPGHREVVSGVTDLGAAWLWKNDLAFCGTSLCYYREAWERVKFADGPRNGMATSEYEHWKQAHPYVLVSSIKCPAGPSDAPMEPRMIGSIHGANSMNYERNERNSMTWKRVPEWDKHCREVMAL